MDAVAVMEGHIQHTLTCCGEKYTTIRRPWGPADIKFKFNGHGKPASADHGLPPVQQPFKLAD